MIKRLIPLLAAFAAVCAFGALSASSVSALPAFLAASGKTFPLSFTGEGSLTELNTANHSIHCTTTHIIGKILPQPSTSESMLGDIQFHILGCEEKRAGVPCSSGKLSTKLILTPEYLWHLGKLFILATGAKYVLLLVLFGQTAFNCGIEGVISETIKVTGNVIGCFGNKFNEPTTEEHIWFAQSSAGVQEYRTFEALLPEETRSSLDLTSEVVGSGKPELASLVAAATLTTDGNVTLAVP